MSDVFARNKRVLNSQNHPVSVILKVIRLCCRTLEQKLIGAFFSCYSVILERIQNKYTFYLINRRASLFWQSQGYCYKCKYNITNHKNKLFYEHRSTKVSVKGCVIIFSACVWKGGFILRLCKQLVKSSKER